MICNTYVANIGKMVIECKKTEIFSNLANQQFFLRFRLRMSLRFRFILRKSTNQQLQQLSKSATLTTLANQHF